MKNFEKIFYLLLFILSFFRVVGSLEKFPAYFKFSVSSKFVQILNSDNHLHTRGISGKYPVILKYLKNQLWIPQLARTLLHMYGQTISH